MVFHSPIVRSEVVETGFGFYTNEAIRNLSVCQITSPVSQDSLGNYIQGGLYDSKLGCTEVGMNCPTCGLGYIHCPGHCGHIELDVPVYHPMLFHSMFSLLKSKCVYCHRFRISSTRCRHTLIKLQLLEMGEVKNSNDLDDFVHPSLVDDSKEQALLHSDEVESQLKIYEERYQAFSNMSTKPRVDPYFRTLQSKLIETFIKLSIAIQKCENCGAFSPKFRKDGYSKIFQKPLSSKALKPMRAMRMEFKSGLEALNRDDNMRDDSDNDNEDDSDSSHGDDGDDDDETDENGTKMDKNKKSKQSDKYLVPIEVQAQIKLLWRQHTELLDFIWSRAIHSGVKSLINGWDTFFIKVCLVPPNRFRPAAKVGESIAEHPQTSNLAKIIEANEKIRIIQLESMARTKSTQTQSNLNLQQFMDMSETEEDEDTMNMIHTSSSSLPAPTQELSKLISSWITLQNAVNCYMDSAKDPNILTNQNGPPGIRQLLERKEGLFRKNIMGKRVNYCCRSVISPDPYIGVNEIGIPVKFASVLHYPTSVNDWNVKYLRTLVERGPFEYPGANQIETPDGKIIKLEKLSVQERMAKAKLLLVTPGIKVYRHLVDGDVLLVNRQPTLHKPGIMAHKARILKHVKEQTLRMNYANCNAYNADFDGDEINCHFVQNELARAEANFICNTDNQYIVPTSGNPLRGLIQDHVASAVKLSCKDTFLTKQQFQQILYVGVCGLPGTEIVSPSDLMIMPLPTIWKPEPLWTGKQIFSSLLAHICRPPLPSLNLSGKTKTPTSAFGEGEEEDLVLYRCGELLRGIMDKAAIGNASLGLVHAVYELYGADHAGRLLSALGRMLTYYLQDAGHSCGVEDLTLTMKADMERNRLLGEVNKDAMIGLKAFLATDNDSNNNNNNNSNNNKNSSSTSSTDTIYGIDLSQEEIDNRIHSMLSIDRNKNKSKLDSAMQSAISASVSKVFKACIPNGLERSFLKNSFTIMVSTGAKGSTVNQSQITCFLGQQALEGQRVPMMASGKTLPSFRPYDTSPRAGGFVRDRFLTGVKPQEYYFHCMAGREGLVDTAVKTSRSGYLQRCLMKHLEDLKVNYDMTVRDSGGNIVQFLYGEDGIDPMSSATLRGEPNQMSFLAKNNQALVHKYNINHQFFDNGLDIESSQIYNDRMLRIRECIQSMSSKPIEECLHVSTVVYARKRVNTSLPWSSTNVMKKYFIAEIIKVRSNQNNINSNSNSNGNNIVNTTVYDLQYDDGSIEKKVPIFILQKLKSADKSITYSDVVYGHAKKYGYGRIPFYIITIKLPDPIMSVLSLGSNVGSISEKVQDAIMSYVKTNPDGVITDSTSNTTINKESLELLVWVKYMRSLACPGEAVGCVAAQSIGEPSTQMTLNTFHLAGHGGANVTLGIPRLREIIMTASKSQKTPTMLLPINPLYHKTSSEAMSSAKLLARKLGRLALSSLLHHEGGVIVGEQLTMGVGGFWERCYDITLKFESLVSIEKAFDLSFQSIIDSVKTMFMSKLTYLIRLEQRRAGDRSSGRHDVLNQFRSMGGGSAEEIGGIAKKTSTHHRGDIGNNDNGGGSERRRAGDWGGEEDNGDGDGDGFIVGSSSSSSRVKGGNKGKKSELDMVLDDSSDSDEDDEDRDSDEEVNKNKERGLYEDDDVEDEEEDDDTKKTQDVRKTMQKSSKISSNSDDDDDNDDDNDDDDDDDNDDDDNDEDLKLSKQVLSIATSATKLTTKRVLSTDTKRNGLSTSSLSEKNGKIEKNQKQLDNNNDNDDSNHNEIMKKSSIDESNKSTKKGTKKSFSSSIGKEDGLTIDERNGTIQFKLSFPSQSRRLLMVQMVEKSAQSTTVRATKYISNAYAIVHQYTDMNGKNVEGAAVQTEGVNFEAVWNLPDSLIKQSDIRSNDIWNILSTYGIEAARQSIVSEINGVFKVYGIDVNPRHLSLIADFMTRTGSYHAMNRIGMNENSSALLQMSFETTCSFLLKAVQEGRYDNQESPSARIVLGSVPKIGTGCFDLMIPIQNNNSSHNN